MGALRQVRWTENLDVDGQKTWMDRKHGWVPKERWHAVRRIREIKNSGSRMLDKGEEAKLQHLA